MTNNNATIVGVGLVFACLGATNCARYGSDGGGEVYYRGPVSSHFNGTVFFNPEGEEGTGGAQRDGTRHSFEIATGEAGHHNWPKSVPITPSVPPQRVSGEDMLVTWVGHATTLVQTQGLNILLDPVWSHRDSPVPFAGPLRHRAPGIALKNLPPIDLILISHNHYDHLDLGVLKFLARRDKPLIVTALGNDELLARHGIPAIGRDWDQHVVVRPGIQVIVERAHHWSEHWLHDRDRALWSGFTVTLPGGNLYYAGDTGFGEMRWAQDAVRRGPIRLAILPIGPYHVNSPPTGNHIDPVGAVEAFKILNAPYALGVHWGTFELSDEPIDGPPTRLRVELSREGISASRFRTLEAGGQWTIPKMSN